MHFALSFQEAMSSLLRQNFNRYTSAFSFGPTAFSGSSAWAGPWSNSYIFIGKKGIISKSSS